MAKKILMILANNFTNDSRVLKEATSLVKAGYHVTIKCFWEKGLKANENINGINIQRLKLPARGKSKIKKIFRIALFNIKAIFSESYDFIHCHDVETLPTGIAIKALSFGRKKLIYDAHEYETERYYITGIIKKFLQIIERCLIKYADQVICVSDSIANEYVRLYNICKPHLVLNCPKYLRKNSNKDLFRKKFDLQKDQIIFLYQGGFSKGRGIEILLEVFKQIQDPKKVIILMGYGPLEAKIKKAAAKNKNIFYHNAVKPDELLDYTSSADIGFLFYENNCLNHYYCSPNKFFEYTQAGIPVIVSNLFEMRRLVKKYENGIAVEENTEALQNAINSINSTKIKQYIKNIAEMKKEYCWEKQEEVLLKLYQELH